MKQLYILGAGGFGREVLTWAMQCHGFEKEWMIAGFIDDDENLVGRKIHGCQVVATTENHRVTSEDVFICAIGDPETKKSVCQKILVKGGTFTNIIHPSVILGQNVKLGIGVILCPYVVATCDITISDFSTINLASTIGHDTFIGPWVTVSPGCSLGGGSTLNEGSFLGAGVTILPSARVGTFSIVGAGSVVLKKVANGVTAFGNPASAIMKK